MSKVKSYLQKLFHRDHHSNEHASKPVLHTFGLSVWSAVPELAIQELGLDVDTKIVNVVEGENFAPEFLKLNPKGTLPTLAVDGKTFTSSTDVTHYLVQTASKKVTPGHPELIAKIHDDKYDPNFILLTTRNEEELKTASTGFPITFVQNRQNALEKYSALPEGAKFKDFYTEKLEANGGVLKIYKGEVPSADFFNTSTTHWQTIVGYIQNDLPTILPESGFIGGAEPGEDDFHIGAWLARVAWVSGADKEEEGYKALEKELKAPVPEKVVSYWKAWSARASWKKVYAETLH
ncbi:hypothetical protein PHLCEN_2v11736 [Hermanssonia centrifuga]|uniref:GST N-terminal domain-containing protein n=1 Tax=Hermanssonia centrifuga TaxID=98765 RepID=A0A2R6NJ74_9APHY|nr:hypothetical protein PHLCEN_2v11736 [Hermanssonia centrifuga]